MRAMILLIPALLMGCETEPQTSYCESLCDWASDCASSEREVDSTLYEDCLEATETVDDSCADASSGEMNIAAAELLSQCTDAVDEKNLAGECSNFTGSIDELKLAAPPAECISQGIDAQSTFEAAQDATTETNDQLCDRFTLQFCSRMDTCVVSQLGDVPDSVWKELGGTALELCQSSSGVSDFYNSCTTEALYEAEVDFTDVNIARQGARECLKNLDDVSCTELLSGSVPNVCAASFTSTEQALSFAGGLLDVYGTIEGALGD